MNRKVIARPLSGRGNLSLNCDKTLRLLRFARNDIIEFCVDAKCCRSQGGDVQLNFLQKETVGIKIFAVARFWSAIVIIRRGGREAEGNGLLNRRRGECFYRGFESRPLRSSLCYERLAVRVVLCGTPIF